MNFHRETIFSGKTDLQSNTLNKLFHQCKSHAQTFIKETKSWSWWDAYRKAWSILRIQCVDLNLASLLWTSGVFQNVLGGNEG